MIQHSTKEDAELEARCQIEKALKSGSWLVVVVSKDEADRLLMEHTTFNFLKGDFSMVLEYLRQSFNRELEIQPVEPLPLAAHLQSQNGERQ